VGLRREKVNWVLDLDVRGFFDNVAHEWLVKFVEHRVADRRAIGLIQKWLRAGVTEEGEWKETEVGTPLKGQWYCLCWRTSICTMSSICG
jgi:RNA-directed DNA polymerase